jgi:hypothetical protein
MCEDPQCNLCVYAEWETGNSEYYSESWVEDCKCPYISEGTLDKVFDNQEPCPFFLPQHEYIWFFRDKIFSCPECKSPRINVTDFFLEEQNNGFPYVASGICQHCEHKFTIISKKAYLLGEYDPINYQKLLSQLPVIQLG